MPPSPVTMNNQDRKDLEKFTKFFIFKSIQTIVQSRLGERVKTRSKEKSSGTEWFNLAILDIQEVQIEIKKALAGRQVLSAESLQPVCVEISLKTSENEWMILETWCIEWDSNVIDQSVKVSYTVYNRLSILLKSLTCITRLVPAYRISRQQSADAYLMCYRVYVGEPQVAHLGDNFLTKRVGQVTTPAGALGVTVAFRTRMLLAPGLQQTGVAAAAGCRQFATSARSNPSASTTTTMMNVKEDHYDVATTTKDDSRNGAADGLSTTPTTTDDAAVMSNQKPDAGAAHHLCIRRQNSIEAQGAPDEDMCNSFLFSTSPTEAEPGFVNFQHQIDGAEQSAATTTTTTTTTGKNSHRQQQQQPRSPSGATRLGAFAPTSRPSSSDAKKSPTHNNNNNNNDDVDDVDDDDADGIIPDTPFPGMFHMSLDEESNNSKSEGGVSNSAKSGGGDHGRNDEDECPSPRAPTSASEDPEFVLVELRPPFAEADAKCDVGAFYRDCQNAPQLACFEDKACNLETTVQAITDRLSFYDEAQVDLDKFVESLAVSDESEASDPENV